MYTFFTKIYLLLIMAAVLLQAGTPPPQEHFTCDDTLFISNRSQLGTGGNSNADSGATWLHSIDRSTNPYAYNSIGEGYVSDGYNAMGYNVKDDFIYALDHQHLLKIDKNGVVKNLGPIEGLTASQLYSGEFDRNGSYYVGIYGGGGSELFKIDIDALKVTKTIPLTYENNDSTADVKFWDMAIDETGNYFYMMLLNYNNISKNDKFAKLNISTGKITIIDNPINSGFSDMFSNMFGNNTGQNPSDINSTAVVFSDKLGKVYAQSDEGGFYQVDTNTGKVYELSSTQPLTFYNDAASCPDAIIDFSKKDFGDAPDGYPHVSHKISSNLYLGEAKPDSETEQQSSADASGDGSDDSDGVQNLPPLTVGDTSYTVPVKVFNNTGETATITAWIDFNRDGIFQYNEALNTSHLEIPSSNTPQTVNVTWDNFTDDETTAIDNAKIGKTFMRIRLTTSRVWRCDSEHYSNAPENHDYQDNYLVSPDGEVEDYEIDIKDKGTPFECTNEGHIFNSDPDVDQFTNGVTIDLENGTMGTSTQFATRHINAAGYNVKDNFIYGIGFKSNENNLTELVRVDKNYKVESFPIAGLPQTYNDNGTERTLFYAYGDVSFDNKLYFTELGELKTLRVIDLKTKTLLPSVPLVYPEDNSTIIKSADYAFNPVDKMLYVVNSRNHQLTKIDPESGVVTELGDVGLDHENIYSVVSFFDLKGNYYFNNDGANKMFKIDISKPADVNATAAPYLDGFQLSTSGDGAKCAYSFVPPVETGTPGQFNVERVGSSDLTINSPERNAWYTQIVGKDFDYHVVFYDKNMTKELNLTNVPIKVELIDQDKNMSIAAPHYDYFSASSLYKTRVLVTKPIYDDDLKDTFASKNARFRVEYPTFKDGTVRPYICNAGVSAKECFNQAIHSTADNIPTYPKYSYARDNFAIRPDMIYVNIADHNQSRLNSKKDSSLSLAAGYEYNLTVTATQYAGENPAKGYTKKANSSIDLNSTGLTCNDTSAISEDINFTNGLFQDLSFTHNNVGKYLLKIEDDTSWTEVDQNGSVKGCIENSGTNDDNITGEDGKIGCNTIMAINNPIELNFQPDHFAVNLNMLNLPASTHADFIYMVELNATNNNVAISFEGDITAQAKNNTPTTNFTAGCVATDTLLDLNASTVSVDETNQVTRTDGQVTTIDKITDVNFSRVIRFNHQGNPATFDVNNQLTRINNAVPIDSSRFLNENNGSMSLDMRYNLNKNIKKLINPVQVTFNSIDVHAADANSSAYQIDNHVPSGTKEFLNNNVKNFYFARVLSDKDEYPRVNTTIDSLVSTPLHVDIYCKTTIQDYCKDRRVFTNSALAGTSREQNGYYISIKHNGEKDGNVTNLTASSNNVTINPDSDPDPTVNTIVLNNGSNGKVNENFNNCSTPSVVVTIKTDPVLDFVPSQYVVKCTDVNASQWTGVGKTGKILKVTPQVNKSGKMEW